MANNRFLAGRFVPLFVFTAVLLLCAGSLDYTAGWIYLVTNSIANLISFFAIRSNPELLSERAKPGRGTKRWDKILLGLSGIIYLIILATAGIDAGRFHKLPGLSGPPLVLGVGLTFAGLYFFLKAQKENKYFSSVVRIQSDRGHEVCQTGLYSVIRHPGNLGMIISLSGLPFLLGSLWSAVPTLAAVILMWIRTDLEDKTLKAELCGYPEYATKTHYRLIPFVWLV